MGGGGVCQAGWWLRFSRCEQSRRHFQQVHMESDSPAGQGMLAGTPARRSLGSSAGLGEGTWGCSEPPRACSPTPLLMPTLQMSSPTSAQLALSDASPAEFCLSGSLNADGGTDPAGTHRPVFPPRPSCLWQYEPEACWRVRDRLLTKDPPANFF